MPLRLLTLPTAAGPQDLLVDDLHLEAHLADLRIPLDHALRLVAEAVPDPPDDPTCIVVDTGAIAGLSGLRRLEPGDAAWWARRPGREYPSHLVAGALVPTRHLTAWVHRERSWPGAPLRIRTLYAGEPAPREIHDPNLPLDEMDAAIAFWTAHALVVPG